MFQDYLFYGTDVEMRYAYRMVHLSGLVRHAQALHGLPGSRAVLLAEVLTSNMLLASILEDEERINLRIQAGGEFAIAAETTRHAETRGYFECVDDSPLVQRIDRGDGLPSTAELYVRSLRSRTGVQGVFEGHSQAETNSLEDALNDHLARSFQMKTELRVQAWLDERDNQLRAFGVIYLELPGLETSVAQRLWNHVYNLPSMKDLYGRSDDPDALAKALVPDTTRPINSVNPTWGCTCSQASIEDVLMRLSRNDLLEMAAEPEPTSVRCHYCNKTYFVSHTRLKELAVRKDVTQVPTFKPLN